MAYWVTDCLHIHIRTLMSGLYCPQLAKAGTPEGAAHCPLKWNIIRKLILFICVCCSVVAGGLKQCECKGPKPQRDHCEMFWTAIHFCSYGFYFWDSLRQMAQCWSVRFDWGRNTKCRSHVAKPAGQDQRVLLVINTINTIIWVSIFTIQHCIWLFQTWFRLFTLFNPIFTVWKFSLMYGGSVQIQVEYRHLL